MCITHSVYRNVYVPRRSASLQSGIANYWPGMHNTAFKSFFVDPCEQKQKLFFLKIVYGLTIK